MKRLFLIILGLLLGGASISQNISRGEYWFDQDYASRQDVFVVNDSLQWQANAAGLSTGLHRLNLHIQDANGYWSSPRSFIFLHHPSPQSAAATYTYWFDDEAANTHGGTLTNGMMLVDASSLTAGLHLFTLMCQIGSAVRVEQYLFTHIPDIASAQGTYTYWFDHNTAGSQSGTLVDGTMMADATSLSVGIHQFTLICQVGTSVRVGLYLFYKMPEAVVATDLTFHYRIDNGDFQTMPISPQGSVINLELDMFALEEGAHTIDHYITNGNNDILSPLQTDTFIRAHIPEYYTLTVLTSDEEMGRVLGGGLWPDTEPVTITAVPYANYYFSHWNDNVTENPRDVVLTSDTTFIAYFTDEVGVDNYALEKISVYGSQGQIFVGMETPKSVWIYDMQGKIVAFKQVTDNTYTVSVSKGTYIVKVGETYIRKVVVTE